jgi:hypothetical protein
MLLPAALLANVLRELSLYMNLFKSSRFLLACGLSARGFLEICNRSRCIGMR